MGAGERALLFQLEKTTRKLESQISHHFSTAGLHRSEFLLAHHFEGGKVFVADSLSQDLQSTVNSVCILLEYVHTVL